ncbi:MAG: hypothetical protein AAF639_35520 [Chloroflexota bacterium]
MWLIADYEPVTLFSLRQSTATASGGKTLLSPTPFVVKMALLDACCRVQGLEQAKAQWPMIRDLTVAMKPSTYAVVSNLFQKILRPRRKDPKKKQDMTQPDAGPFQKNIGYREYVHFSGQFQIALGWHEIQGRPWLEELLLNINYFGRRGGFFQLIPPPIYQEELPSDLTIVNDEQLAFSIQGTLQIMDDCSNKLTFEQVDIYSDKGITIGKDRLLRHIVVPYKIERSSRSYTLYQRIDEVSG